MKNLNKAVIEHDTTSYTQWVADPIQVGGHQFPVYFVVAAVEGLFIGLLLVLSYTMGDTSKTRRF